MVDSDKFSAALQFARRSYGPAFNVNGHAYISPSGISKVIKCPASASREFFVDSRNAYFAMRGVVSAETKAEEQMIKEMTGTDEDANLDGTILHGFLETALHRPEVGRDTEDYVRLVIEGSKLSDNAREDDELIASFIKTLQGVEEFMATQKWFITECSIPVPSQSSSGSADLVAAEDLGSGWKLYIGDLKTGRREVSADHNAQMMTYALGILECLELFNLALPETIQLEILGLRFPSSQCTLRPQEIFEWRDKVLTPAMEAAYQFDAQPKAGEHCIYCSAKMYCQNWRSYVNRAGFQELFEMTDEQLQEVDDTKLVDMYMVAKQVEKAQDRMKVEIMSRTLRGTEIAQDKRLYLVRPKPTYEFADSKDAAQFLAEHYPEMASQFTVQQAVNAKEFRRYLDALGSEDEDLEKLLVEKVKRPYIKMS